MSTFVTTISFVAPFCLNACLMLALKFGQISNEHQNGAMVVFLLLAESVDCLSSTICLLTWEFWTIKNWKKFIPPSSMWSK